MPFNSLDFSKFKFCLINLLIASIPKLEEGYVYGKLSAGILESGAPFLKR
jgi:hypothetical protein